METEHQSVRDYIAALKRGDRAETDRLRNEAIDRFHARTTDSTELRRMFDALMTVPFGQDL